MEEISTRLGVSPLMAQCLCNREEDTPEAAKTFLEPFLRNLGNPFDLPDMSIAVDRLLLARERKEPITIFGDYDVDGVTATALLMEFFKKLGWNWMGSFLPLRMEEGYGLSDNGVQHCLELYPQTKVLLAVDCGSTSSKTITQLQQKGLDVIVLDHHQIDASERPHPTALINPQNIPPDTPPSPQVRNLQNLCSAGVAFKLAHALLKRARELKLAWGKDFDLKTVLDLVCMGTIADLVKLKGENRIFVTHGLKRIRETERPGLQELIKISHRTFVSVYDVSFYLAPRINAAGRLEDAQMALELLTTHDKDLAVKLALQLDQINQERKGLQHRIAQEVINRVRRNFNPERDFIIVEASFEWHLGVIGIAAAQVAKLFHRPVIILGGNGQNWRGSCRSIEGFDMANALHQCEELLLNHGGHSMAAGVEVELNKLEPFRVKINRVAKECLANKIMKPTLQLDAEVTLANMRSDNLQELFRIGPFGMGNPPLSFIARHLHCARAPRKFGQLKKHLKLFLTDEKEGTPIEAVIWNYEGNEFPSNGTFDIAFEPTLDSFTGQEITRFRILDWKIENNTSN